MAVSSSDVFPWASVPVRSPLQPASDGTGGVVASQVDIPVPTVPERRLTLQDVPGFVLPVYDLEDGTQTTRKPSDTTTTVPDSDDDSEQEDGGLDEFQYCYTCKETWELDEDGFAYLECPYCHSEDVVFLVSDDPNYTEAIRPEDDRFPVKPIETDDGGEYAYPADYVPFFCG